MLFSALLTCWLHMSCVTCSFFIAKSSRFRLHATEQRGVELQPREGCHTWLFASHVGSFQCQCLKVKNALSFCNLNEPFRPTERRAGLDSSFPWKQGNSSAVNSVKQLSLWLVLLPEQTGHSAPSPEDERPVKPPPTLASSDH